MYVDAPEDPAEPRQWEVAAATLLQARNMTEAAGAKLLVAYIPRKLRVYDGFLDAAPDSYARLWRNSSLPDAMADWCRAQQIAFLDLTQPLRAAVARGQSVYLPDDVHWNSAGHAFAARAVADAIASTWPAETDRRNR